MSSYSAEQFDSEEEDILRRYFTNLDRPVFALVNLPEVVKGALFARYSRSAKSLRRLFLDEFVGEFTDFRAQGVSIVLLFRSLVFSLFLFRCHILCELIKLLCKVLAIVLLPIVIK